MRIFILSILLIPIYAFAKAPECPLYANKHDCLHSVEENYQNFLDFLREEEEKEKKDELIQAAVDIKHFESLACQKTCLN